MPVNPALAHTLAGDDWPVTEFVPPRIENIPSAGYRDPELESAALYLCAETGLILDPWEEWYFLESLKLAACADPGRCQLGPGPHTHWAALECGLCVPRQNGKGAILEAKELVALFIDEEKYPHLAARLTVHSAHEAKTAHEGFERLEALISNSPRLRAKLRGKPRQSEGAEVIRLLDGRRIRFRTRTGAGARGLSGDFVIFDEAMILSETIHGAVWPIITARGNPQVFYTGSAVDQREPLMDVHGIVFSRVRKRGTAGDQDLLYSEWSLPYEAPEEVSLEMAQDPESWAKSNPGLDVRLSRRIIAVEQRSLSTRNFCRERLGVGDWPDPDAANQVIDEQKWRDATVDESSVMLDPICFAVDVSPGRDRAAIAVAGKNAAGKVQVEIVKRFRSTARIVPTVKELVKDRPRTLVVVDNVGSGASLIDALELEKISVRPVTSGEHARGCGMFYDGVDEGTLNHLGDPALNAAVSGAVKRPLGDRWAWSRDKSSVDISPLVAATLALYGFLHDRARVPSVIGAAELLSEDEDASGLMESDLPPLNEEDLR